MDKKEINNDELRRVNLDAIKSIKKHLHIPKMKESLYYVPVYEKGIILLAVRMLRDMYFDPEIDIVELNKRIHMSVKTARGELDAKKQDASESGDETSTSQRLA